MKLSTLLAATIAAAALTSLVSTVAHSAPADDGYVTRAVRSNNGKDNFVQLVKVPKTQAVAENHDCPMMKDRAAMKAMCAEMADCHSPPAPKG